MKQSISFKNVLRSTSLPLAIMLFAVQVNAVQGAAIATWNLLGAGGPTFGTSTLAPSSSDSNLTVGSFTRGPGLTTSGTGANNAWGANGWNGPTDAAGSVAAGDFITFSLQANSGYGLSLSGFDPYNIRRSGTGPSTGQWQYSLDGSTFADIGSPITWGSTTTAAGNAQVALDLSGITALQNVPNSTTVTFRVANYNSTNAGGTWYFNGGGSPTSFVIEGTLSPLVIGGGSPYWDGNGSAPGVGGAGTWDTTSNSWNSAADGSGTLSTYSSANPAKFGGTAGTVTIASGGVTADASVQFEVGGYNVTGDSLTLGNSNSTISVTNAADIATINSQISGSNGVTKAGAGTLVLGAVNNFTGAVHVNSGILSIATETSLGDSGNAIILGGGTLQATDNLALTSSHSLDGGGTLDVAAGKTLTVDGAVGTAPGLLALNNTGTVKFTNGSTNAITGLSFSSGGTLDVTGATLSLPGNITATNTDGTATLSGNVNLGAGTRSISVANGSAAIDLQLSGNLSGASVLAVTGAGTLSLTGDNSGLIGSGGTPATIRQGTAGTTPVTGGTIAFNNANALGTGQLQLNGGTLRNDSGALLVIANANGISSGAQDHANTPGGLVFAGSDLEFSGGIALFKATGGNYQHQITVNNNTTIDGTFGVTTGSGVSTGLTVAGSGKLALANAANTIDVPVTVNTATLAINGSLSSSAITITNGGKLQGNGTVSGNVIVDTLGSVRPGNGVGTLNFANDLTLAGGGNAVWQLGALSTTNPGTDFDSITVAGNLSLGGTSSLTLDFGLLAPAQLPAGGNTFWSSSHSWKILDTASNTASANFTSLNGAAGPGTWALSLGTGGDIGDIFLSYTASAASLTGDVNGDHIVNQLDLNVVFGNWLSTGASLSQGDANNDGVINQLDINTITGNWLATGSASGGIQSSAVPEPSTFVLLGLGMAGLVYRGRHRRLLNI